MSRSRRLLALVAACALLVLPGAAAVAAQSADDPSMMDHTDMSADQGQMAMPDTEAMPSMDPMPSMAADGQMAGESEAMTPAETMPDTSMTP